MTQFIFFSNPWLLPIVAVLTFGLLIEAPYRVLSSRSDIRPANRDIWNIMQSGLITLTAFVLSLSFAQASTRFDARRALVVTEANAIGTTWLRADQLEPSQTKRFRQILTDYTAMRLNGYQTPGDPNQHGPALEESDRDQAALWSIASAAARAHPADLGLSLLMQTLNDTIDVSAEQLQALTNRVPTAMFLLTFVVAAMTMFCVGVRCGQERSRPPLFSAILVVVFAIVISMAVDYDRPQTGLVNVDLKPLVRQLQSMQQAH
jgi:hypothetical protein